MLRWKVWRLPVVTSDTKQLVGIICRSDILSPLTETFGDLRRLGEDLERDEHIATLPKAVTFDDDDVPSEFFSDEADEIIRFLEKSQDSDEQSEEEDEEERRVEPDEVHFWWPSTVTNRSP